MDNLTEHEAFLRAIFDAPDDDMTRLVYADYLEENGEPERAEFIRVTCEEARLLREFAPGHPELTALPALNVRRIGLQKALARTHPRLFSAFAFYRRGFGEVSDRVTLNLKDTTDPRDLRRRSVLECPTWLAATRVSIRGERLSSAWPIEWILTSATFARVTSLDLRREPPAAPVLHSGGVVALAACPGVVRLESLTLTGNDLDDSAAIAIAASSHFTRLRRLNVLEGNRLTEATRQRLIDRFGPDVVR